MPTLAEIFTKIETGKAVRIALPMSGDMEKERLSCVYQKAEAPEFLLLFSLGSLPVERIDTNRKAAVLLDIRGESVSLAADIEQIIGDQTLRLIARDVISHEQLRDYFRVDVSAPLIARSAIPEKRLTDETAWALNGETIDVSGSGLLALFPEPLDQKKPVLVELILPTGEATIVKTIAHVVRTKKTADNQYQVGLHFDQIDSEDRDRIMACCFEIQRKHLRLNVQVRNPV